MLGPDDDASPMLLATAVLKSLSAADAAYGDDFGCVVVASIILVMTGMAVIGAFVGMWLMEKTLDFLTRND